MSAIVTLPFQHVELFQNESATRPRNLVEELTFSWEGTLELSPNFDQWVDTEVLPERQIEIGPGREFWEQISDLIPFEAEDGVWNTVAGTGDFEWELLGADRRNSALATHPNGNMQMSQVWAQRNELQAQGINPLVSGFQNGQAWTRGVNTFTLPDGTEVNLDNPIQGTPGSGAQNWGLLETQIQERITDTRALETETSLNELGDRVVDVGLVPYMRSRIIIGTATNIKAETKFYVFFDGQDVTEHCSPDIEFLEPSTFGEDLISREDGVLQFAFRIPSGTFNVGQKTLKITDDPQNRDARFASTFASAQYTANGLSVVKEGTVVAVEEPRIVGNQVIEQREVQELVGYLPYEPLAYTFFIDDEDGIYLTKFDLFFRKKSDRKNVIVQIRDVVNGFPGPHVLPNGEKILHRDDINVSEDATAVTEVSFPSPIYLQGDTEYCIVLIPENNVTDYELWVSELGEFDITTGRRIVDLPGAGIVFTSANNRAWTPHQQEDFKCTIHRAEFNTGVAGKVRYSNKSFDRFTVGNLTGLLQVDEPVVGSTFINLQGQPEILVLDEGDTITITGGDVPIEAEVLSINALRLELLLTTPDDYFFEVDAGSIFTDNASTEWTIASTEKAEGRVIRSTSQELAIRGSNGLFNEDMKIAGLYSASRGEITGIANIPVNLIQPRVSQLLHPGTSIEWKAITSDGVVTREFDISVNREFMLPLEQQILSRSNEVLLSGGNRSFQIEATIRSTNPKLSPAISSDRAGSVVTHYRINEGDLETETTNVGDNLGRYFTKPIQLVIPAEDLNVYFDAKIPLGASVAVFFKMKHQDDPRAFNDIEWIAGDDIATENGNRMTEYFFTIPDEFKTDGVYQYEHAGNTYVGFEKYAIKLVLRAANTSAFPRAARLRTIALLV